MCFLLQLSNQYVEAPFLLILLPQPSVCKRSYQFTWHIQGVLIGVSSESLYSAHHPRKLYMETPNRAGKQWWREFQPMTVSLLLRSRIRCVQCAWITFFLVFAMHVSIGRFCWPSIRLGWVTAKLALATAAVTSIFPIASQLLDWIWKILLLWRFHVCN